jgi:hypothetical protein
MHNPRSSTTQNILHAKHTTMQRKARMPSKQTSIVQLAAMASSLLVGASAAATADNHEWQVDVTLYFLGAGLSGDVGVGPVNAAVNVGLSDLLQHLEFGAMGKMRVASDRWAFALDVIYMGLGGSKNGVSVDMDQWVVEPTVGVRVSPRIELLAGARYNDLSGEILGPGVLPTPRMATGKQDWWDPIVGANVKLLIAAEWSFDLRVDVGGFGIGSDLTWQAFPGVTWQFGKQTSMQAGYRWVYTDYATGSGVSGFGYDMLTQGPQVGVTYQF